MSRLLAFLRQHSRIALDTNVFIYHLEENFLYLPLTDLVFEWIDKPDSRFVTSTLTMAELLVQPLRNGDKARAELFYSLLSTYPNIEWLAPRIEIAQLAASYRAEHRLKTIDALHVATAVQGSATGLITNDAALARVPGIDVLVLETLLSA